MRCICLCSCEKFQYQELQNFLRESHNCTFYRQVIHIRREINEKECEVFYFPFGTTIIWGSTPDMDAVILNELNPFEVKSLSKIEDDEFTFSYGETYEILEDHITLPDQDPLTKLALSHAMAQSVKLSTFETMIKKRIDSTQKIPEDLFIRGRIQLSKKELRKKMGEIFLERSSINLNYDLLDTPDFFWENVDLEPIYLKMAKYLDLKSRVDTMNVRLNIVNELFEMIRHELDTQHGTRLEWIVIILIFIEVIMSLIRDHF
jgi:uncharacterized Rmd1/YagE family protein